MYIFTNGKIMVFFYINDIITVYYLDNLEAAAKFITML